MPDHSDLNQTSDMLVNENLALIDDSFNDRANSISIINYKDQAAIQINQELSHPLHATNPGPLIYNSSGASSANHGGKMLRKSYDEESDF